MVVTLIEKSQIYSVSLPEKVKGRFWITDYSDLESKRYLISVEASDGKWVLKGSELASLYDAGGNATEKTILEECFFYRVKIFDEEDEAYIYAEETNPERQIFNKYIIENNTELSIGRDADNDICINNKYVSGHHAVLNYVNGVWTVSDLHSTNGTFVNDKRVTVMKLKPGDNIFIIGFKLLIGGSFFAFNNPKHTVSYDYNRIHDLVMQTPDLTNSEKESSIHTDFFYRAPRFKREIETLKFKVDAPPEASAGDGLPLPMVIGPSLTMGMASMSSGAFSVINTMNSGGNMMNVAPTLAMSVSMLLGMVLWPILTKKYESKQARKKEAERQKLYKDYLFSIRDIILREKGLQEQILKENNIDVSEAIDRIINRLSNLWERTIDRDDFLCVNLGNGNTPMKEEILFPDKKFSIKNDNLINDMFALANEPRELQLVPIVHNFKDNVVTGIIGANRKNTYEFVMALLIKLVALHSYDELKLVFIVKENEKDIWEFVKWFPHVWDNEHKVRYYATNIKEAKEISSNLEQEFYDRLLLKKNEVVTPHYLIIATDKGIAEKTEIYQKILSTEECRGYSIINVYDEFRMLPKETASVIEINEQDSKVYAKQDISGKAVLFNAERQLSIDIRAISKALANVPLDIASQLYELPDMITFLDMYGVNKIEHLNPLMRWKINDPTASLSAPVGVDTVGELFTLDLHEKYQGPHGLVAGMTGSGKSEFIITYILSMAINYHPDEVAFILIDYKGGGLTGAFEDKERGIKLPHLAGTITNLDGAAVKRSLISIQSELRRRQAIFNEARKISNEGTMDIYKYQKLYRDKVVTEPVPHLFIISDEFAELKTQQPEFMAQLISAARIGRSLGVHLILATQKPSGVVDDQIWSNTRFRVCLKVQDKSDSNDMIKRPDAAELAHTGRFYLQVGFNEFFAKGQSAWCGATYYESGASDNKKTRSVKIIDNTGRIVKEVKEKKQSVNLGKKTKQIVAIVKYLSDIAKEENIYERPLWMDEIPAIIYTKELIEKYDVPDDEAHILEPVVGEIDDPFNQNQSVFRLPITNGGNTIVYGTAGSGKLTFVNTLIYELIRHHSAEYLNLYILDFGSETLKVFENAPQVGGVVFSPEKEKIINLMKMLKKEISKRKKDFAEYGGDYQSYIKNAKKPYPNILVIINNYAAFAETYEECEEVVAYVTREGTKYGMFFVITANNTNSVRFRLVQNFKNLYVMQMNDKDDYTSILGTTEGTYPSQHKGRGLLKTEHTYEFQTAVFSTPDELNDVIKQLSNELLANTTCVAKKIPVLPKKVDIDYFAESTVELDKFPVGVITKNLELANINIRDNYISFALANELNMISSFAQGIAELMSIKNLGLINVIDAGKDFARDDDRKYTYCADNYEETIVTMFNEVVRRHKIYKANQDMGDEKHQIYIIYGFTKLFTYLSDDGQDKLKVALEKGKSELRVSFLLMDEGSQMSKQSMENWYKAHCGNVSGIWIGDGSSEQYLLKITKVASELYQELPAGIGVYISKGRYSIVKHITSKNVLDTNESEG